MDIGLGVGYKILMALKTRLCPQVFCPWGYFRRLITFARFSASFSVQPTASIKRPALKRTTTIKTV